jgi:peptidase C39-like protein
VFGQGDPGGRSREIAVSTNPAASRAIFCGVTFLDQPLDIGAPMATSRFVRSSILVCGFCSLGLQIRAQDSRVDVDEFFKDTYAKVAKLDTSTNEELTRKATMPEKIPELPAKFRFEEAWQAGNKCGTVALYVVLSLEGYTVTYDEVDQLLPDHPEGSSMAELQSAAAKFGVELRPVKVTLEELRTLPMPCIVHWSIRGQKADPAGHFDVLVQHAEGFGFDFVNTTHCLLTRMPYISVAPQFDGYALVPVHGRASKQSRLEIALWVLLGTVITANLGYAAFLFRTR